jgi:hypothetical protein
MEIIPKANRPRHTLEAMLTTVPQAGGRRDYPYRQELGGAVGESERRVRVRNGPRDFVDEWLKTDWRETSKWSETVQEWR